MDPSVQTVPTPYVSKRLDGGVVTLTLNRGERFNPLSSGMIAALESELDALATDETARAVVLAGAGRGFCAGHDLKEMRAHSDDKAWQQQLFSDCNRMMIKLTELPQPVFARVHGIATAAGCQLVSMCDLAVASEEARFALPGVNVGVFCSTPAVGVVRNVGRKRAMEMLLTGEQHLHRALAADVSHDAYRRRRAEHADVDAGKRESGLLRGHSQVAHRDQLAARGGGDAVHPGEHRLGQLGQLDHHAVAVREQLLLPRLVVAVRTR